ncbi:MAG: MATE family efflux transporter [Actinomycetota bacterium]
MPSTTRRAVHRDHDRQILRLAGPAFLALVSEPLFLLADAAIVGHLGTDQLAGLGIAGAVVQTAVGLCIFLAYGTTASVARRVGAGDLRGALAQGIDGVWLAVLIGVLTTALGLPLTRPLVGAFDMDPGPTEHAVSYLGWAWLGVTPLLVVLAATGVLRGLQDTRTPLYVAVGGNLLNIVLNVLLVYGLELGIAGAAIGTVLAQTAMAVALLVVVVRGARAHGSSLSPDLPGGRAPPRAGVALVVRTLTLRASLLVMTYSAATLGAVATATQQLAMTLWTFLAFALDAIAIAAQAITGHTLGTGDRAATRAAARRMVQWGLASGVVTGLALALAAPLLGPLFTADEAVHRMLWPVLLVAAAFQPVAGVVFVLDGVLIGAGDGRYLAWGGVVVLALFAPAALLSTVLDGSAGLVALWVVFGALFMGTRAVVLLHRARGTAWMTTGVPARR